MNRLMARKRIWIALALVLPVVVFLIGVLLFQGICSFWCRQVPIIGVVGFVEFALVACCASTAIMSLISLALWHRRIITAHQPTRDTWLLASALIMLITFIPIAIILTSFFPGQFAAIINNPLLWGMLWPVSWGTAVGMGILLKISLVRAWALKSDEYPGWARLFAGSWNWGWLSICTGAFPSPIIGLVTMRGGNPIPLSVWWIAFWCIGWWKIGIPIGLWLNKEVLPKEHHIAQHPGTV